MITISIPDATRMKNGHWNINMMVNGERISITKKTRWEVEKEAFAIKLQAMYRKDFKQDMYGVVYGNKTLSKAIDDYIDERSNILSPTTINGYRTIQRNRFKSVMDKPMYSVTNWQEVVNKETKIISPKTLINSWAFIKSVLERNDIQVPYIALPQLPKKEQAFFEPEQVEIFTKAIIDNRYELCFLLGLHGLRRSEMLALEKKNIKNGYIHVETTLVNGDNGWEEKPTTKTKGSKRKVPILMDRVNELVSLAPDNEKLCPFRNISLSRVLQRIEEKNNLPIVTYHGLRHTFASICFHLGIPEQQTMEFGGWVTPDVMRKIYTHLASSDRIKAEEKLKDFFSDKA